MRTAIPVILTLLAAHSAFAQSESTGAEPVVEGQVYDHLGGGVKDVAVSLFANDAGEGAKPIATATTNHYGDFALHHDGPLTGEFIVVFTKERFTETRRDVEIVPGELPPFVDLLLPGALKVHGKITDARNDRPLAVAIARLTVAGSERTETTDENGAFEFDQVHPGRARLRVEAEGFGRAAEEFEVAADAPPITIALKPGKTCRIKVTDWQGNPVAGAKLDCIDEASNERWWGTSDGEGLIVLDGIPADTSVLIAMLTHDHYISDTSYARQIPLPEETGVSEHPLNLLSAGTVTGKILDAESNRPLNGVRVTVGEGMTPGLPQSWTDFDGQYEITGVPPGKSAVSTYLRGHAPEMKIVSVEPNETTSVDFNIPPSKEAGGRIVNEDDEPIASAYLFATSWRGHNTLGVAGMTDEKGMFTLDTIPADEFEITIQATGYEPLQDRVITTGRMDHRFEMKARQQQAPGQPPTALNPGDPFPELELTTLDGKSINTAKLKGKTVLIDFWATWCGPCIAEIPSLVELHKQYGDRDDFLMINISIDADGDLDKVRKLVKKHDMKWTHVAGKDAGAQDAAEKCGVILIPTKFLIGSDGRIRDPGFPGGSLEEAVQKSLNESTDPPDGE